MINHFIYIVTFGILFILFQLFVGVNSQTISQPDLREAHTATFINNILYILGGFIPNTTTSPKEIFLSLDFSNNFNTTNLSWVDLSSNSIPPHRYATCGENNNKLFLYGGESLSNAPLSSLVYTFDTQNIAKGWSPQSNINSLSTGRASITSIVTDNGLMYLFGGRSDATTFSNDMIALDTNNLTLRKFSSINAPSPRAEYGAVLLPNRNIIYMGGYDNNGRLNLSQVYLYDTMNNIWSTKQTTGIIPTPRYSFSSVLGLDGQTVIIFGGIGDLDPEFLAYEQLYVLNITNFNWKIPFSTGVPLNRAYHKSVVIGKYMVVTFGEGYFRNESDVLLLDISSNDRYIWSTSFTQAPITPPSSTQTVVIDTITTLAHPQTATVALSPDTSSTSSSSLSPLIIGLIVILSILAISLIISFIYIRKIKSIFLSIKRIPIIRNRSNRPMPQHNDQENNFNFDNRM